MLVEKGKLPKGMSWPLKTSSMLRVVTSAKIGFDAHLIYGVSRIFFDAHFWPPNPNVPYERLYIRIGAVPAKQAREIREFVQAAVITTWVQSIISLPANSPIRRKKQCFRYDLPPRMWATRPPATAGNVPLRGPQGPTHAFRAPEWQPYLASRTKTGGR